MSLAKFYPRNFDFHLEFLALAPGVRRHFKETMTTKRLLDLPVEAQCKAAHTVSTFSMDTNQGHYQPNQHCHFR